MQKESHSWIESSDVFPMFPTLVWKTQLKAELHESMDSRLLFMINGMRKETPMLTAGQGWQSEHTLHHHAAFQELVSYVDRAAHSVLHSLRVGYDRIGITGCWANVLPKGAAHRAHCHPNNYLSGVYYVRTDAGADRISFHDPRNQTNIIRPPVTELTAENTDQVVFKVTNGTLLLFPAYLQHSVDSNTSEIERVSISFNLMFAGFFEKLSKPLW